MLIKYEPYQAKEILVKSDSNLNTLYRSMYVINPYRGCAVGCRYCYVQARKFNNSIALEEAKQQIVQVKINAPFLLNKKLSSGIDPLPITIGESCEPFSEAEDKYFITQRILEILSVHNFPVHLITRFPRVLRDLGIIKKISEKSFACVTVSIPVISAPLVKKLEGKTPDIKDRLRIISALKKENISSGIAISPVFPFISNESDVEKILKKAASAGADYVLFNALTIKEYQKDMIFSWVSEKYPDLLSDFKKMYIDSENPPETYWRNYLSLMRSKVDKMGMKMHLPFKANTAQQQELFALTDHV